MATTVDISWWWLAYPALGTFVGFMAGMFGVGGGLTIVPILFLLFEAQGYAHQHLMHLALATSMASIVVTSFAATRAHHQLGNVDWAIVRSMAFGLLVGTSVASFYTSYVPTNPLAYLFTAIVAYASAQMVLDFKPKPSRQMPGTSAQIGVGWLIGNLAAVTAASGAFMAIPYMVWHNIPIKRAIGTSAAIGLPVALAGLAGYITSGVVNKPEAGIPALTFGFINIPALVGIVTCTMLLTPVGARLACRLPVVKLKRFYGAYLLLVACKMLHSAVTHA